MNAPLSLYKYESFTAQSLQNLKDQVVYFGSPLNFNDPYDCALSPSIKEPSDIDVERIRKHYLKDPQLNAITRSEFEMTSTAALKNTLVRIGKNVLEEEIKKFLSIRGVSCFSEMKENLLMWSHYGDHCKGFCLEFSTLVDPFQKTRRVNYTQEMPVVDIVPMLCDEDYGQVLDLYCTKAIDWAYEKEWRAIHTKAGTAYTYESKALTGIFLGPDMPFAAVEIIALVVAGQNEHVQLWQGKRSKTKFSVEFERMTYTSHLQAKRQGLLEQ